MLKLENVKVIYANLDKVDKFGKNGLTIGCSKEQVTDFTTAKIGDTCTVRCSGKPSAKNIIGDIAQGDTVTVLVEPTTFEDSVYPRLLAVKLVEKYQPEDEKDYTDEF